MLVLDVPLAVVSSYPFVGSPYVSVLDVILTESEKASEFLLWLSLLGIMAFDLLGNYSLKRERH